MVATIKQGKNTPLNVQTGTVPNVSGAMLNWFQPMVFGVVSTTVEGFQAVQTQEQIRFQGVIQPLTERQLLLKPEGQRAWTWFMLHAEPQLTLQVDSVVTYLGVQTRVMARKDYTIYGYVQYELVQDWTGAGPTPVPSETVDVYNGGEPDTEFENELNGGEPDTEYTEDIDGGSVAE